MKKVLLFSFSLFIIFSVNIAQADVWGVRVLSQSNDIVKLDPFTGAVSTVYTAPNFQTDNTKIGLAGWSYEIFYTNANSENGKVYKINPATGTTIGSYAVSGGWEVNGLGYWSGGGQGFIYTSGCSVNDVHRYNALDGASPTFYWSNISGPLSMAGDNGGKIYTVGSDSTGLFGIWGMNPTTDENATWFATSPSADIVGMAYDGIYLYLSDTANHLYTMNNAGQLINTLDLDYTLFALGSTEGTGGAVPEPATMLLLGSGLIGLAGYGRKKFFKK